MNNTDTAPPDPTAVTVHTVAIELNNTPFLTRSVASYSKAVPCLFACPGRNIAPTMLPSLSFLLLADEGLIIFFAFQMISLSALSETVRQLDVVSLMVVFVRVFSSTMMEYHFP